MHSASCCCWETGQSGLFFLLPKMLLVVDLARSLRTPRTLLWSRESKLPWKPWEPLWMGWFNLTGEADTDITDGSLGAPGACWDREKSNSQARKSNFKLQMFWCLKKSWRLMAPAVKAVLKQCVQAFVSEEQIHRGLWEQHCGDRGAPDPCMQPLRFYISYHYGRIFLTCE